MESRTIYTTKKLKKHKHHTTLLVPSINVIKSLSYSLSSPSYCPFHDTIKYARYIGIVVQQSSSSTLFSVKKLTPRQLMTLIMNPHLVSNHNCNLVEVASKGSVRPTNLPDLSDLSLFPKCLKLFYVWVVSRYTCSNYMRNNRALLNETSPALPANRELFKMGGGSHNLVFHSSTSTFKLIQFDEVRTSKIQFSYKVQNVSSDWRDGRKIEMSFTCHHDKINAGTRKRKRGHGRGGTIAIWNCRGMGTNGFAEALDDIIANYTPDICIFSEIRMDKFLCVATLQRFSYFTLHVIPPQGIAGGLAIIGMNKWAKFSQTYCSRISSEVDLCL